MRERTANLETHEPTHVRQRTLTWQRTKKRGNRSILVDKICWAFLGSPRPHGQCALSQSSKYITWKISTSTRHKRHEVLEKESNWFQYWFQSVLAFPCHKIRSLVEATSNPHPIRGWLRFGNRIRTIPDGCATDADKIKAEERESLDSTTTAQRSTIAADRYMVKKTLRQMLLRSRVKEEKIRKQTGATCYFLFSSMPESQRRR